MQNCSNLYFLSTIACQLASCLTEEETAILAADLATLGCMLSSILVHQAPSIASESNSTTMNPPPQIIELSIN